MQQQRSRQHAMQECIIRHASPLQVPNAENKPELPQNQQYSRTERGHSRREEATSLASLALIVLILSLHTSLAALHHHAAARYYYHAPSGPEDPSVTPRGSHRACRC